MKSKLLISAASFSADRLLPFNGTGVLSESDTIFSQLVAPGLIAGSTTSVTSRFLQGRTKAASNGIRAIVMHLRF